MESPFPRSPVLLLEIAAVGGLSVGSVCGDLNAFVKAYLWTPPEAYWFLLALVLIQTMATGWNLKRPAPELGKKLARYALGYSAIAGCFFLMGKFNPSLDWVRALFMDIALLAHGYLLVQAAIKGDFLNADVGTQLGDGLKARRKALTPAEVSPTGEAGSSDQ